MAGKVKGKGGKPARAAGRPGADAPGLRKRLAE